MLCINLSLQEFEAYKSGVQTNRDCVSDLVKRLDHVVSEIKMVYAEKVRCSCWLSFALYVVEKHYLSTGME
jgi:hypothetical protein